MRFLWPQVHFSTFCFLDAHTQEVVVSAKICVLMDTAEEKIAQRKWSKIVGMVYVPWGEKYLEPNKPS